MENKKIIIYHIERKIDTDMFKIEWKRIWRNPFTYIALLAGLIVCIIEIFVDVVPELEFLLGRAIMEYPDTVFDKGIMFSYSKYTEFYYTIIPLLAVIPGGVSFYQDIESGYIRQIITRESRKKYYMAKLTTAFLSAGLVAVIPLIVNFMICMALLPATIPQLGGMKVGIRHGCMFAELFFENPFLYTGIYLIIDFIIAGVLVLFAVSISWISFSKYLVMFMPFMIFYVLHFIAQYIGMSDWSPLYMLMSDQGLSIDGVKVFILILLMLVASGVMFVIGGKKHEVL